MRHLVLLCAALLWIAGDAGAVTPTDELLNRLQPQPGVRVYDHAGLLNESQRADLETRLRALEEKTTAQIAVVTVNSMAGGQVDDFTHKLFINWGVGQKRKDNGVMLFIALQDRKAHIEVGYGLEPILPDALCGRILDEELFPQFKQSRYAEGISRAVGKLAERIEKGEPASATERPSSHKMDNPVVIVSFLSLFVVVGMAMAGAGLASRTFFMVLWGALFGGIPMFMATQTPFGFLLIPVGLVMLVFGYRQGRAKPWKFRITPAHAYNSSGSVWGMGGGFSSGGGGGGFGGGSSGGGGASGGW